MNLGINLWYLLLAVVVVAGLIWALAWHSSTAWHDRQAARRQLEADKKLDETRGFISSDRGLLEPRVPLPTCKGWLYGTAWGGSSREGKTWADPWAAQDRIYDPLWDQRRFIGPDTVPMSAALDMAEAAYQLGQGRAEADQVHAEAEAIWAEVEADPGRWQA